MQTPIKHLVFEGTGVRNAIYAGGLLALEEAGLLGHVESVVGTSSGSIVATMYSLGYTPQEIADEILALDFSKILDGMPLTGPIRLLTRYGWHAGDYFRAQMQAIVAKKTGDPHSTFAQCAARGFRRLHVVSCNVTKRVVRVFPDPMSQDLELADAVRISMSIPLFFASVPYQGDIYVDGGVMWNYPIGLFDQLTHVNDATLGFHVKNTQLPATARTWTPHDYFAGLFESLIRQQETDLEQRPLDRARTVTIPDGGFGLADFGIDRAGKAQLLEAGREGTRRFLQMRREHKDAAPAVHAREARPAIEHVEMP
jgi:NTE family protein